MTGVNLMTILMSLQREKAEIKQKNEDEMCTLRQKSEDDLCTLKQENEKMRKRLFGKRVEKTKVIILFGRSKANTHDPEKEVEGSHHTGIHRPWEKGDTRLWTTL